MRHRHRKPWDRANLNQVKEAKLTVAKLGQLECLCRLCSCREGPSQVSMLLLRAFFETFCESDKEYLIQCEARLSARQR